jgi:lysophospholipase L1-like esterase
MMKRFLSTLCSFALGLLAVALCLSAIEFAFRLTTKSMPWPSYAFDKDHGFLHKRGEPGVNSLGFFDVERQPQKAPGVFRVLLLGDSFVDGQPVASELEQELSKLAKGKPVEVIPMGISGTGTVQQLAFYEHLGKSFSPDVVIVLFVPNDFANNSNILESVRIRYDPFKPGRPFVVKGPDGFLRLPPVADFDKYLLKELPSHPQQSIFRFLELKLNSLLSNSSAYEYIKNRAYILDEDSLYHHFDGEFAYRICQLKARPEIPLSLEGWHFPADLDMDAMFLAQGQNLPGVFTDAQDFTVFALEEFRRHSREDGFIFLLAATDSCTFFPESWLRDWRKKAEQGDRMIDPKNFSNRVKDAAAQAEVNYFDLYPEFARQKDIRDAHLPNDNHWNARGCQLAGKAIASHIVERGWLR